MGDSSISSDSAGDRSISPTRSDEPQQQPTVAEPVPLRQPSPVLVSKRLAEEAMAKRNSRLSQLSENVPVPVPVANGSAGKGPAPRAGPKKRMAPAPPPPQSNLTIDETIKSNASHSKVRPLQQLKYSKFSSFNEFFFLYRLRLKYQ